MGPFWQRHLVGGTRGGSGAHDPVITVVRVDTITNSSEALTRARVSVRIWRLATIVVDAVLVADLSVNDCVDHAAFTVQESKAVGSGSVAQRQARDHADFGNPRSPDHEESAPWHLHPGRDHELGLDGRSGSGDERPSIDACSHRSAIEELDELQIGISAGRIGEDLVDADHVV